MCLFSLRVGNEVGMLRVSERRLKDLRTKRLSSTPTSETYYDKQLQQLTETKTGVIPSFNFVGTLVKVPRWFIGIGIGLIIIGVLFYRLQHTNPLIPAGYLFFWGLLAVIGILLCHFYVSKTTFFI